MNAGGKMGEGIPVSVRLRVGFGLGFGCQGSRGDRTACVLLFDRHAVAHCRWVRGAGLRRSAAVLAAVVLVRQWRACE